MFFCYIIIGLWKSVMKQSWQWRNSSVYDSWGENKNLLFLVKVLFTSANNRQLKAAYFGRRTVVFKMFSTVWQVFCWRCISVCLLFRCFALPPWFLTQSGFEKGDETYQLLATVTSFQLENKSVIHMSWNNGYIWYSENVNLIHFTNFIFHIAFAHLFTFWGCTNLVLSSFWLGR